MPPNQGDQTGEWPRVVASGPTEATLTSPQTEDPAFAAGLAADGEVDMKPTDISDALLAEAAPMYQADTGGVLIFVSPAFRDIARQMFELGTRVLNPNEPPSALRNIFAALQTSDRDVRLRHRLETDGGVRHFRSRHRRLMESGVFTGFAGFYTDITEEVGAVMTGARERDLLKDALRATVDWTWEVDAGLNITRISARILELTEELPEALIGRNLGFLGRFADDNDLLASLNEMKANPVPFRDRRFIVPGQQRKSRHVSLSGVPVFEPVSGQFAGYRGTGREIPDEGPGESRAQLAYLDMQSSLDQLRARNDQLDMALNEARSLARAKTEFLGKVSHELRTPLNAIIGFSEMGVRQVFGSISEKYLSYFRDINNAAGHLLSIINDILDAVSLEADKVSIDVASVSLSNILAEARVLIELRAQQQGVDISPLFLNQDYIVRADVGRARQILLNLLSNAIKFTPPGGQVGAEAVVLGGDMIGITIWDTGRGIPADEQARIFDSFHQVAGDVMSDPQEGTGLGLNVSQQLAQLMGGEITVESEAGKGARFTLTLPVGSPAQQR